MMSINDDSCVVNKLETSLTDDAGVVIYDRHMFIVQATDMGAKKLIQYISVKNIFGHIVVWEIEG